MVDERIAKGKEDIEFWIKLIKKNLKNGKFWYDKGEEKAIYFILKVEQYGYDCTSYRNEIKELKLAYEKL